MGDSTNLERLRIDRGSPAAQPGSNPRRGRFPFGKLLLLGVLAGGLWLFRVPLLEKVDRFRLPTVEVQRAARTSLLAASATEGTAANGYIVARRRAALSADAPGRIVEMNVEEGSVVQAGDVVARLFFDGAEAGLSQAEAALASGRRGFERARAEVSAADSRVLERERTIEAAVAALESDMAVAKLAALESNRALNLLEQAVGNQAEVDRTAAEERSANARVAASQAQLERARSERETAGSEAAVMAARADEAEARIAELDAAVAQAAAALENTYVRAPFDGLVVLKDAEVGEVVSPNSQGAQSRGSVATLVDFASLEAQVEVPESNLASIRQDAPAEVFLDAFPERGYAGRVTRIWPTANRQKATVEVRVALERLDANLRPEMGVRVVFAPEDAGEGADDADASLESLAGKLLIPLDSLIDDGADRGVFVLERDVVRFQPLTLGDERDGRVIVEQGLEEGDSFVVRPPPRISDGDRVRVAS